MADLLSGLPTRPVGLVKSLRGRTIDMAETTPIDGYGWALRAGNLEVRLAETPTEIEAAQSLRFRVFYQEMAAQPTVEMRECRRDFDPYDAVADHLLVIDRARGRGAQAVVGCYRLIRREAAERFGSFYTASEYDISAIDAQPGEILELGRSCIDADYRSGPAMQLLWRGVAAYVFEFDIELMFGCASFAGVDPDGLAVPLSYLHHFHLAPEALRPRAIDLRYTNMCRLPAEAIDERQALAQIPPLIKGYLRLGGFVGDGAVIDHQFHTTDVCVVVKTDQVTEKYFRHYGRRERRVSKPVLAFRKS